MPVTAILAGRSEVNLDPRSVDDYSLIDFYAARARPQLVNAGCRSPYRVYYRGTRSIALTAGATTTDGRSETMSYQPGGGYGQQPGASGQPYGQQYPGYGQPAGGQPTGDSRRQASRARVFMAGVHGGDSSPAVLRSARVRGQPSLRPAAARPL